MMLFTPLCLLLGTSALAQAHGINAKRDGNCTQLPLGKGPVPSPDNSHEFLTSKELASQANNAPTPENYTESFKNLQASSSTDKYLGYITLDSYDTSRCASECNSRSDCQSINVFFERSPTRQVGPACVDPASTTFIKCALWGTVVTKSTAKNGGFQDHAFVVAIAGSNGYFNERAGKVDLYA